MQATVSVIEEPEFASLRVTFRRDLRLSDLSTVSDWVASYLDRAATPVNVVLDVRAKPLLPVVRTAHCISRMQYHPNIATAYVIGDSPLVQLVERMAETFAQRKSAAVWCGSLEEAYAQM